MYDMYDFCTFSIFKDSGYGDLFLTHVVREHFVHCYQQFPVMKSKM